MNWLKLKCGPISFITITLLSFTVLVLGIYAVKFNGGISNNHTAFAEFGSYIGGTLGPIFTLGTLGMLALSFYLQGKEYIRQEKATRIQIRHLVAQQSMDRERFNIESASRNRDKTRDLVNSQLASLQRVQDKINFYHKEIGHVTFSEAMFCSYGDLLMLSFKVSGPVKSEGSNMFVYHRSWVLAFDGYLIFCNSDSIKNLDKYELSYHLSNALSYLLLARRLDFIDEVEFTAYLMRIRSAFDLYGNQYFPSNCDIWLKQITECYETGSPDNINRWVDSAVNSM